MILSIETAKMTTNVGETEELNSNLRKHFNEVIETMKF